MESESKNIRLMKVDYCSYSSERKRNGDYNP